MAMLTVTPPRTTSAPNWFLRAFGRNKITNTSPSKTSLSSLCEEILKKSQAAFLSGKTKPYQFRIKQLESVVQMLENNESQFLKALQHDLHKPKFEALLSEIAVIKNEAIYAANNLEEWMEPEYVEKTLSTALDECYVLKEPLGVVLVIGHWSFPLQLCLIPFIGAVSAGNCVVVRPSETASNTAELLQNLLPKYLDNECYHVIYGGHKDAQNDLSDLLQHKFDHVFYTGDATTGKLVMQAATKFLTPVTLVLAGKNPCYIDRNCDIYMAARRIAWARFVNAGQNLLAPDYVLCHADVHDKLLKELYTCVTEFYGEAPEKSPDFGRLVSIEHYQKLKELLGCGKLFIGGKSDEGIKYIAPTILLDVKENDPIMEKDIFGPVLPIIKVCALEEAIDIIRKREKPLAVYVYSSNFKVISEVMSRTSSGCFCSNDSGMQNMFLTLPFGGVGGSGMGCCHGKYGFDTFSHRRACILRNIGIECVTYLRYPPYVDKNLSLILWASSLSRRSSGWCQIS